MPTSTTNFDLIKPAVNSVVDEDLWGGQLNTNMDTLDGLLPATPSAETASFNVAASGFNYTYTVDASSGAVTASLPALSAVFSGFVIRFKLIDATNALTIDGDGSETIDGSTTYVITDVNDSITLIATSSGWITSQQAANINGRTAETVTNPAADFLEMYDASLGSNVKVLVQDVITSRGQIDGFITANDTDTDHDISIGAGICRDAANTTSISLASAIVKQIDANWAEGSAAGGFPSGLTLANDTWYKVFVIKKSDGTVDAGFDTSATAANLLSDATGYTEYRRVGYVQTDGSANIKQFTQVGETFYWNTQTLDISALVTGTAANYTINVPTGENVPVLLNVVGDSPVYVRVYSPDVADGVPTNTAAPLATQEGTTPSFCMAVTNTSAQVRARCNSSTTNLRASVISWQDTRGKE